MRLVLGHCKAFMCCVNFLPCVFKMKVQSLGFRYTYIVYQHKRKYHAPTPNGWLPGANGDNTLLNDPLHVITAMYIYTYWCWEHHNKHTRGKKLCTIYQQDNITLWNEDIPFRALITSATSFCSTQGCSAAGGMLSPHRGWSFEAHLRWPLFYF